MPRTGEGAPERSLIPSRRVLIIEDNADGRETLRTVLEMLGHTVEVARDGQQGITKALQWRPEVALVDIGLPILDGYQVAQELRAKFGNDICLIAHTGYGQPEDRTRALEAGFDVHVVKPADFNELFYLLTSLPFRALAQENTPPATELVSSSLEERRGLPVNLPETREAPSEAPIPSS